ncbi:MAG: hypothetical protein MUE88_00020 [Flavobacteriales bacterium]|nr:hypothetical protein [Flavobacteriales bacterium]
MFPPTLQPTDHLPLTVSGHTHHIPRCHPTFTAAPQMHGVHTFGGKDLLLVDGRIFSSTEHADRAENALDMHAVLVTYGLDR